MPATNRVLAGVPSPERLPFGRLRRNNSLFLKRKKQTSRRGAKTFTPARPCRSGSKDLYPPGPVQERFRELPAGNVFYHTEYIYYFWKHQSWHALRIKQIILPPQKQFFERRFRDGYPEPPLGFWAREPWPGHSDRRRRRHPPGAGCSPRPGQSIASRMAAAGPRICTAAGARPAHGGWTRPRAGGQPQQRSRIERIKPYNNLILFQIPSGGKKTCTRNGPWPGPSQGFVPDVQAPRPPSPARTGALPKYPLNLFSFLPNAPLGTLLAVSKSSFLHKNNFRRAVPGWLPGTALRVVAAQAPATHPVRPGRGTLVRTRPAPAANRPETSGIAAGRPGR